MRSFLTITLSLLLTACTAIQRSNTTEENPALIRVLGELSKIQSMDDSAHSPWSIHDRFISDLYYARSFTLNEGLLYLATMADGSILELFSGRAMQVD